MSNNYMDLSSDPDALENAKKYADGLEHYLNQLGDTLIVVGITPKRFKQAVKIVRKLIDKLRDGKLNKIYDQKYYYEFMELEEGSSYSYYMNNNNYDDDNYDEDDY